MTNSKPILLLTGPPGVGKSTVIEKVLARLSGQVGGFYTREIRENGERIAFEMVTLDGQVGRLAVKASANVLFTNAVPLEDYAVDLDAVNAVAVPALQRARAARKIIVMDEIGPMEIFSSQFCETIMAILNDQNTVAMGTVVQRPNGFADLVKAHPRVAVQSVTLQNRSALPDEIYAEILARLASRS